MSDQVSATDLHTLVNDPSTIQSAPGVSLTDLQKKHVAVVLDMFQAKGTMAKLTDNFTDDAVYEDLFATCKNRTEVAGQLLHLPTIMKSAITKHYLVNSSRPVTTTAGEGRQVQADELAVEFKHQFEGNIPVLPQSARTVEMNSTLLIYSSAAEGKIVRLQDRPSDDIPDNALISMLRKFNAVFVPNIVGIPDNDKEDAEKVMSQQR